MQNPAMAGQRYLFGAFTLDASTGTLLRNGAPVSMGQRAVALLQALVAAGGEVVTKDHLIEAAWPRAVVEESNLSVQVAALRKLLGPLPGGGDAIGTVARVGYRFLLPIAVLPAGDAVPAPADLRPSIAVRPLANLSGDPGLEYLADGISEDIIMALSRFRWFRVASRGSSFAFKAPATGAVELAARLNVRYVLEGSLRGAEGRLAFTLQLTDALSDSVAWSERYEIGSGQLPALQHGVAQQVAGAIEPELLKLESAHAARRARSASVQDLVHRGTFLFHQVAPATHREARELFRQACGLDPAFGQAQFWLARVSAGLVAYGWTSHPDADLAEGLAAAAKAIQADERDPYAHYALAIVSVFAARPDQAIRAAHRALELAPGFALGHLVLGMARLHAGDAAGAIASLEEGLRLNPCDPQNFVWQHTLSTALLLGGNPAGALDAALHARALRPEWSPALEAQARSLAALGRGDAARECMAQLRTMPPAPSDVLGPLRASRPDWADALQDWLARAAPGAANAAD